MSETGLQAAESAFQAGNLAQAGRLYQQVLRSNPRDMQALYGFGLVCLHSEQFAHADYVFAELVRLDPQFADGHCIRGIALARMGRPRDALASFERALALRPDSLEARSNYGAAFLDLGEHERGLAELDRALTLDPGHAFSWHNRGNALKSMQRLEEAVESYSKAVEIEPGFRLAAESRDQALFELQRLNRCPADFTRRLFDEFSVHYDSTMRYSLDYRGPEILSELAGRIIPAGDRPLRILDLGCGTGLVAEAFVRFANGGAIDGIDLSPKMIEAAQCRGIYRNLILGDLESVLAGDGPQYDLVLAADSMIYLGDLFPCLSGVSRRLIPDGWFLFTTEAGQEKDWELSAATNRFRHSETYLRSAANRCGLAVLAVESCVIRHEYSAPVAGFALALRKPPEASG